ncbi:hypothetical protein AVEN_159546-1 [Araneus ventricosus]|uniref:Uncharacterized protein n=1 Tax=Araneus ventricosus TaxID=182803 RepID=A0A4Y2RGY3_ARAVE|nr:hypothetical protein AVEN_159546-1 [Araneus ventricosus]
MPPPPAGSFSMSFRTLLPTFSIRRFLAFVDRTTGDRGNSMPSLPTDRHVRFLRIPDEPVSKLTGYPLNTPYKLLYPTRVPQSFFNPLDQDQRWDEHNKVYTVMVCNSSGMENLRASWVSYVYLPVIYNLH